MNIAWSAGVDCHLQERENKKWNTVENIDDNNKNVNNDEDAEENGNVYGDGADNNSNH